MKNFIVVIPARLESTRLPRKPLIEIKGVSMIERTYLQCIQAVDPKEVYVATDSEEIEKHCREKGIQVIMTSKEALTGTDRVYEVSKIIEAKYYVNVQGDEPVCNPKDLMKVISGIDYTKERILNGYTEIKNEIEFTSQSVPKVVVSPVNKLLYMSRAPIPGNKLGIFVKGWRQVCIYAFPLNALRDFSSVSKTPLEEQEDIEILRFLELGYEVEMLKLSDQSIPVDLPEDLEKVERFLSEQKL